MRASLRLPALAAAVLMVASIARAADVIETAPADIGEAVKRDRVSVVLFTSPDPGCGFCIGADTAFDAYAQAHSVDGVSYRRVQWSPWKVFPAMDMRAHVHGVPVVFVFRGEQPVAQMSERVGSQSALLTSRIEQALSGSLPPLFGEQKPNRNPKPPKEPAPSESERDAVRLAIMGGLLTQATERCRTLNAHQRDSLRTALTQWRARQRPEPDSTVRAILDRLGGEAVDQLVMDADRRLADRLRPNDASEAGCDAFGQLLGKL